MPGGKKSKPQSKGRQQPKGKKQKPRNFNPAGTTAAMRRNDIQAGGFDVSASVAKGQVRRSSPPKMITMRNGDCRIVHREYIQDIQAPIGPPPSAFFAYSLPINPGQEGSFPWLSNVAKNFESYKFKKLKFCYETEAATSTPGTVVLSVDYDSADPTPATKQQAMAYRGSVRSPPWTPSCHMSLTEDLSKQKQYFVRPGLPVPGTDIKTYDTGNLFVITQGVTPAPTDLGELYVEYDVELYTPIYEPGADNSSGWLYPGGPDGINQSNLFGVEPQQNAGDVVITVVGGSGNNLNVSGLTVGGSYAVSLASTGTGITTPATVLSYGSTFTVINALEGIDSGSESAYMGIVTANASSGNITLDAAATTITGSIMSIAEVPPWPAPLRGFTRRQKTAKIREPPLSANPPENYKGKLKEWCDRVQVLPRYTEQMTGAGEHTRWHVSVSVPGLMFVGQGKARCLVDAQHEAARDWFRQTDGHCEEFETKILGLPPRAVRKDEPPY